MTAEDDPPSTSSDKVPTMTPPVPRTQKGKELMHPRQTSRTQLAKVQKTKLQAATVPSQEPLESAEAILIRQIELEEARNKLNKRTKQPTTTRTPTLTINQLTDITQIHVTARTTQPTQPSNTQTPLTQATPAIPTQHKPKAVK